MLDPKFLAFEEWPIVKPKVTRTFTVRNAISKQVIGKISWWPGWRKYVFHPSPKTIFDSGCMRHIGNYCEDLTIEHKRARDASR